MVLNFTSVEGFVELSIERYEFPESGDKYDLNWLVVQAVHHENCKTERLQDACLLTWELKKLRDSFIRRPGRESSLTFLEPELSFSLSADLARCSLKLEYGLVPTWAKNEIGGGGKEFRFDVRFDAKRYSDALNEMCEAFPVRTPACQ